MGKARLLGALILSFRKKRILTSDQVRPLTIIGNQIGIAIENSFLHERLKKQTERLEALQGISAQLTSTLYLENILRLIIKSAQDLLEVKEGALIISQEVKKRSSVSSIRDIRSKGFRTVQLDPARKGPGMKAFESKAPVITRYRHSDLSSLITAPLMLQDGTNLGILAVGTKNHRHFLQEEARLLAHLPARLLLQ
jgi:nitrate/nitrite-specific signal transduction histidine kinase